MRPPSRIEVERGIGLAEAGNGAPAMYIITLEKVQETHNFANGQEQSCSSPMLLDLLHAIPSSNDAWAATQRTPQSKDPM